MSNPAQRLHSILETSRKQSIQGMSMMDGWRNVLDLPPEIDDMLTMNKVGKVFTLPHVIELQLKRFEDLDLDLYLGWRKDLTLAFRYIYFQTNFSEYASRLSDSLLINIKFCAHELDKRMPEKNVNNDELAALREEATVLFDSILKADLPPSLSRYLLDHLYKIIEAIDDYLITGAPAIEAALNQVIGTVATDRSMAEAAKNSPFGDSFWTFMSRVALILTISKTANELGMAIKALLRNNG